jgi:hypothetical protein
MNPTKKNIIIGLVIGAVLVGGAAYPLWTYFKEKPAFSGNTDTNIFTPSADIAADGNTASLQTALTQGTEAFDVSVVPLEVVEDSRCPIDVVCIQAGTVRLLARVTTSFGEKTLIFTLGRPEVVDDSAIELTLVLPTTRSTAPIEKADYRFTFKVTKLIGTFDVKG